MGRHPKEYQQFDRLTTRLLAVPHDTIKARQDRYLEESKQNPRRRGPKPKSAPVVTSSDDASRDPAAE